MVLRCSLLGHDFGDTEVEHEREERGSEVVVTVQEFEECSRCGERNVISENTEVTSLAAGTDADSLPNDHDPDPTEPPLEPDATDELTSETDAAVIDTDESATETDAEFIDADEPDSGGDAAFVDADEPVTETDAEFIDAGESSSETDAEFIDDDTTESTVESTPTDSDTETTSAETTATDDIDLPTDENGDPVVDDGEILEDDDLAPERDREHGEWPDSSDVGPPVGADSAPTEWPDDDTDTGTDTEDVAADPTSTDDDAVVIDNDVPADARNDARSVTAAPPTDDATDDTTDDASSESASGIEWADSVPTPTDRDNGTADDVPTEFYCPRCDYVASGDRASLRAGDICPDCRKGYLSEREHQ
ncbi:hypothetical protein BDK88_0506 [Natrinema hispanicum]|uniref:Uncharacterized protein n=1 Tax=Natrinema hispanicum TaxID=392421 RepID=A0A482YB10_9EURY|nr:hypothetical protein [Natrinema hispanicum]RZV11626.1 hypothetical protein BDK88_0506 [Natrinema hispanicum]